MRIASKYSSEESPAHPALEVKLSDPSSKKEKRIIAKVDTGFSGSLLVRLDDYLSLGLQLPQILDIQSAPDVKPCHVETPLNDARHRRRTHSRPP